MSDEQGDMTWEHRKAAVREKYRETLSRLKRIGTPETAGDLDAPPTPDESMTAPTPGSAPSAPVIAGGSSVMADEPPSASSDTSATDTAVTAPPTSPPASTTPAASTSNSSGVSTAWTVPLSGWLELNSTQNIVDLSGSLVPGLSPNTHVFLHKLATARGEPVGAVVQQIAEWFLEQEDERAEGPLGDALEFYASNYQL